MDLSQLMEESSLDVQKTQQLKNYFWQHVDEIVDDPNGLDVEDFTPEIGALLLHLSFQITGSADLQLTAKTLLHYQRTHATISRSVGLALSNDVHSSRVRIPSAIPAKLI
jgi:hypothetical protein